MPHNYVEILFEEPESIEKYIKYPANKFNLMSLEDFKPYLYLLELERVKVTDMETELISTRFGITEAKISAQEWNLCS